jgi:hypothetical protein
VSTRKIFRPPLDKKTRKLLKEKDKLWKDYKRCRDDRVYTNYKRKRNQVRRATRKEAKNYERRIAKDSKDNPKRFWSYMKKKTKLSSGICDLKKPNGEITKNNQEKADLLGEYFSSVLVNDPTRVLGFHGRCSEEDAIHHCNITRERVLSKLKELKAHKSPGPDGIHPRVLKEACTSLAEPLSLLFQKSLTTGQLPKEWKTGTISAIFKKGRRDQASNYRPVSLTSVICKVMESILREYIMTHLLDKNLISDRQYGFVPGRSTLLQLLTCLDHWTEAIEDGCVVDVIYCDFMKAFDRVPYNFLLEKIHGYGIQSEIYGWIKDFLRERMQQVRVDNHLSKWYPVTSGIPQGSVLGPLLFVLFINDLPDHVKASETYLFADDLKVFKRIKPGQEDRDCTKLQDDINRIKSWSEENALQVGF